LGYFKEIVIFFAETEEKREEIIDLINERKYFTDAARLNSNIKKESVYALSLNGETIDYIAKGTKAGRVATFMDRIKFSNFFEVNVSIAEITQSIKGFEDRLTGTVNRIPPAMTKNFIEILKKKESTIESWFEELETAKKRPTINFRREELDDAFKVALKIGNFNLKDRSTVLKTSGVVPDFLEELNEVNLSEDEMINHDLSMFNDWESLTSNVVGMASFEKHREKLYIWNINRKPLESVIGVDLIYYIEEFQSFIMIQYKRMIDENGTWVYRPTDKAYKREFINMKQFEENIPNEQTNSPVDFRLNPCPFFFKLCPSTVNRNEELNLIPGMYVPFEYWEKIIEDSTFAKGKNGGTAISFNNIGRYLTNTEFTGLAQKAWVGSTIDKSKRIAELVSRSIRGDKAVALAALINKEKY